MVSVKYKSLFSKLDRVQGRADGKVVLRHRGGVGRMLSAAVLRTQVLTLLPARVVEIKSNRLFTGSLARLVFFTGLVGFILSPSGLTEGDFVINFDRKIQEFDEYVQPGNGFKLAEVPVGSMIYGIELNPGMGESLVRSAGTYGICLGLSSDNRYTIVELPSKERRMVLNSCSARIGRVSNEKHWLVRLTNAGVKRLQGRRPHVRGVAMNPIDHPHGGGEGKTSGGRHPVSPWGVLAKGKKTRKTINKFMVSRKV